MAPLCFCLVVFCARERRLVYSGGNDSSPDVFCRFAADVPWCGSALDQPDRGSHESHLQATTRLTTVGFGSNLGAKRTAEEILHAPWRPKSESRNSMSDYVEWVMQGAEFVNCNCSWGCPCQFNSLPTHGHCRAFCFVQIEQGRFVDRPLDGLRWGILAAWPGAIHHGNGKLQTIIDERANPGQRKAIEAVSHGRETDPGSLIFQVFSTTITEFLPTLYKPIDLAIDYTARTARVKVPGVVGGNAESIRNPVTGAAHAVRLTLPTGFEYTDSEVLSGKSKPTGPIELDLDGSHAHLARIHWSTHGVVR